MKYLASIVIIVFLLLVFGMAGYGTYLNIPAFASGPRKQLKLLYVHHHGKTWQASELKIVDASRGHEFRYLDFTEAVTGNNIEVYGDFVIERVYEK